MEYDFDNKYETVLYNKESINDYISSEDLSILYSNIRGLKTNYNNLEIFIQNFKIKPDIIICAETGNLQHHQLYNLNDSNYDMSMTVT